MQGGLTVHVHVFHVWPVPLEQQSEWEAPVSSGYLLHPQSWPGQVVVGTMMGNGGLRLPLKPTGYQKRSYTSVSHKYKSLPMQAQSVHSAGLQPKAAGWLKKLEFTFRYGRTPAGPELCCCHIITGQSSMNPITPVPQQVKHPWPLNNVPHSHGPVPLWTSAN